MDKENLLKILMPIILGSILTLVGTMFALKYQHYVENEDVKKITIELLSSEIGSNLYDILGDDDIENIKKTQTSLTDLQKTTIYNIRGTMREFYDRNLNSLILLNNTTTTISIINFYHLLKAVDEDTTFIKSISKENSNRELLIKAYESLVEDVRKARVFGRRSLALLKYYYNPEYLKELDPKPEAEKIIFNIIETLPLNATTTAEKILIDHGGSGILNEVSIEFLFLKSKLMNIVDKNQGIYQRVPSLSESKNNQFYKTFYEKNLPQIVNPNP